MKTVAKKQSAPATLELVREVDNLATGEITIDSPTKGIRPDSKIPLMESYAQAEKKANEGKTSQELAEEEAAMNARFQKMAGNIQAKGGNEPSPVVSGTIVEEDDEENRILETCDLLAKEFFTQYKGMTEAWLRMGFALIKAKTVIPHGKFMKWREERYPDYGKTYLSNAMQVAEHVIKNQYDWTASQVMKMPYKNYWTFAEKQIEQFKNASRKMLLMAVREIKPSANDDKNEMHCREHFEDHPEDMDRYLPEIESGEKTWAQVWMAIQGAANSVDEDGHRKETDPIAKLWEHSRKMSYFAEKLESWEGILPERKAMIIDSTAKVIGVFPLETKEYLFKKLKAELGHE